ncbi:MAG: polyphosphate kinase 2 family protein [Planctomycetota bacterium]
MDQPLTIEPGSNIKLADFAARYEGDEWDKKSAAKQREENNEALAELGYKLYAENKRSVLLVLQGMDTSGKDGTIRSIMEGLNPQGCTVTSFKKPTEEELDHDFLWRIHKAAPRRGNIGIFNRSHYEDVLVVRVRSIVPEPVWQARYDMINEFERLLVDNGTTIVKCFLHISKEEQRERLQARLDNPHKRWKFSKGDLAERKLWDDYQQAYEAAVNRCSTDHAPWHIVPSDRKWYRNMVISQILRDTLEKMAPEFPPAEDGLDDITVE